jgi:hypothetical protein
MATNTICLWFDTDAEEAAHCSTRTRSAEHSRQHGQDLLAAPARPAVSIQATGGVRHERLAGANRACRRAAPQRDPGDRPAP